MKFLVLAVMASSFSSAAFAQRHPIQYSSPGGYGTILFPGPGHAPPTPPASVTGPYSSQSPWPPRRSTGLRPSVVIVPWPIYDSGYIADRSGNDQQGDPGQ